MAFTGLLLISGTGCASGLPSSLGNSLGSIDSSRDTRTQQGSSGETGPVKTSEWEIIREVSKPAWARERGQGGDEEYEQSDNAQAAEDSGAESAGAAPADTPAGSADEALVVVDRQHGLSPDYSPDDLVSLHPLGIPTLRGERMKLRDEAAQATSRMVADAGADGIELVVCSAYRSHEAQVVSHERLTALHGEGARGFSAPPGHSEHQLGTVIDVSNASAGYRLNQAFGGTEASRWLDRNATDHGFVLSYPREAEELTGYHWEPWHYRYIGRENALRYAEGDYQSPQRFFLEEGVLPEQ